MIQREPIPTPPNTKCVHCVCLRKRIHNSTPHRAHIPNRGMAPCSHPAPRLPRPERNPAALLAICRPQTAAAIPEELVPSFEPCTPDNPLANDCNPHPPPSYPSSLPPKHTTYNDPRGPHRVHIPNQPQGPHRVHIPNRGIAAGGHPAPPLPRPEHIPAPLPVDLIPCRPPQVEERLCRLGSQEVFPRKGEEREGREERSEDWVVASDRAPLEGGDATDLQAREPCTNTSCTLNQPNPHISAKPEP